MNTSIPFSEQERIAQASVAIRSDAHIGKLLVDAGKLMPPDLERVLDLQQQQNLRFGEAAQKLGLVSEEDVRQVLSQQFEYPYLPADATTLSPELVAATQPHGKVAEALRSVRSELLLRWFKDGRKLLAISGTKPDEGSSYLAANLALSFAQLGRRVLLIDANMRQPSLHRLFNLDAGMGLSDLLAARVPSIQLRGATPFQSLAILTAGSQPPNPAELLARPSFSALITKLQSDYDIVLIDTAPSELGSDFQPVAALAGGVLLAARRNLSRLAPLAELKDRIAYTGAQVLGAVVLD